MFKILIVLFFTSAFSKLTKPSYEYILFEQFNSVQEYPALKRPLPAVEAWVLNLNRNVESLRLRQASREEAREVFGTTVSGPNYRQPRISDEPPTPEEPSTDDAKGNSAELDGKPLLAEIMRVINKFLLTAHSEPDAYEGEVTEKDATLKLYFKGQRTSLVARAEGRQWHYIIGPPSLFPDWFFRVHDVERDDEGAFVQVPSDVAAKFYKALLHMLTTFLSFPV